MIAKTPRKVKEMKTVKTPEYWKEARYQPLVEVTTLSGSKIKIPERLKDSWDFLMNNYKGLISRQGIANGLKTIRESLDTATIKRSKECEDFYKVFAENYQEPN